MKTFKDHMFDDLIVNIRLTLGFALAVIFYKLGHGLSWWDILFVFLVWTAMGAIGYGINKFLDRPSKRRKSLVD